MIKKGYVNFKMVKCVVFWEIIAFLKKLLNKKIFRIQFVGGDTHKVHKWQDVNFSGDRFKNFLKH